MIEKSADSWVSARHGKWHKAVDPKPQWDRKERTKCNKEFTPVNVTWNEMPPAMEFHLCRYCLMAD